MKPFSRGQAYKITSAQILKDTQFITWRIEFSDDHKRDIRTNMIFGLNSPAPNMYLVPCNLVCENRKCENPDSKCIVHKQAGFDPSNCSGQFWYVKNNCNGFGSR